MCEHTTTDDNSRSIGMVRTLQKVWVMLQG
jgi:hypothetical protein